MRLSVLHLAQPVVIPQGRETGGGEVRQDLRESSFTEAEGWQLQMQGSEFIVWRTGMPAPVRIVGYAASYVASPTEKKAGK